MVNSDFILINCLDEWISVDPSTIKIDKSNGLHVSKYKP